METKPLSDQEQAVTKLTQKEFNQTPKAIVRMKVGTGNEVYRVTLDEQEVIVRLNLKNTHFRGSDKYIPLFRANGIEVPNILAKDYSKALVPYCYQVQSKLRGQDIGEIISDLSNTQLEVIAKEIAFIIEKLSSLPTNGQFGYLYNEEVNLKASWTEYIQEMQKTILQRGQSTGVLDKEIAEMLHIVIDKNRSYFDSVHSTFYFDDLSSKNVMIHNGKFQGLVDLDGVMYGDFLEAVGRIKASWYGTPYGTSYTGYVLDALNLNKEKRKMVTAYAFLNRTSWLCETGVQFNDNTSTEINWESVKTNQNIVKAIFAETQT